MRGDTLQFGPRNNDRAGVIILEWGKGLLSFSPEANLAEQVSEVELYGWSPQQARPIIGRSKRGDETGRESGRRGGGEYLAEALGAPTVLHLRQPVHSQAEADRRARALLEEKAEKFIKGSGESIGLPEILPDTNLGVGGLGRLFRGSTTSSRRPTRSAPMAIGRASRCRRPPYERALARTLSVTRRSARPTASCRGSRSPRSPTIATRGASRACASAFPGSRARRSASGRGSRCR